MGDGFHRNGLVLIGSLHPLSQSAIFDFPSLLVVVLLMICTCAYLRERTGWIQQYKKTALGGVLYKFSVLGRRASGYVATACIVMALYLLFIR